MLQSKLCSFDWPYFHKTQSHQKADLCQRPLQILLKKLRSMFHRIKVFHSLVSLETAKLRISQSSLRIFASRSCRFPVLMAGSCYASCFAIATESVLYRVSDTCLIRSSGTSSSFEKYCRVEISLYIFQLNISPAKN